MGFFDQFHTSSTSAIKPQTSTVRKTTSATTTGASSSTRLPPPHLRPSHSTATRNARPSTTTTGGAGARRNAANGTGGDGGAGSRKRRLKGRPVQQALSSGSDDEDVDDGEKWLTTTKRGNKKARTTTTSTTRDVNGGRGGDVDLKRCVRSRSAFLSQEEEGEDGGGAFEMVHAADIAGLSLEGRGKEKFTKAFEVDDEEDLTVEVQYPSLGGRERYQLVLPLEADDMNPLQDILEVVELVAKNYLTDAEARPFLDENEGVHRKLKRAMAWRSCRDFRATIDKYNNALTVLRREGAIVRNLDELHALPLPLVERILTQAYARTVSLKVETLKKYENGTDNVYGELLPRFISKIFQETHLKSEHVFVDLGSGVANVVLQAALEVGCESWGCEMMDNACDLAELQEKEFHARCRLWGLEAGSTHLIRGDFLTSTAVGKALQRADVVLVNNQAFTPSLNNSLVNMFLDLKEGCRIVSLKSFVPSDHKITSRNLNSPVNLLEVQNKEYYSNCVSWTNAPGTYCIAKKDSSKLKAFAESMGL
ncbi:MAG: Nucleosomal histone H3-Lys79 methylase [Piccolia ochrophora]|nr:MAG: Nucleosomal histone H3-Lys79 methylase [Piccolia ochrophora]